MKKKFGFKTWIVETRKINWSQIVLAIGATAALGYNAFLYFQQNRLDFLEKFLEIINYFGPSGTFYAIFFTLLGLLVIPGLYQIFKKKIVQKGQLEFDEKTLKLKSGRERYEIPEQDLDEVRLELRPLPKKEKPGLKGGNFLILPMDDGEHRFEMHIGNKAQQDELLELAEFLKIQHDVKVKVNRK